jgi:cell division protein FtsQ
MPRAVEDPDGDEFSEFRSKRYSDEPARPWWRPEGTWGRVFLGIAALAVIACLASSILFVRNFLERDARFRIATSGNIQAAGLAEVSRSEMLPVFGEDVGRNIFFVPLAERRRQLEQIPWVERATVMRLLPDQIRVSVVERKPVAFVRQGSQIGLVDSNGVLLTMPAATMTQRHYSFPVITGIDGRDPLVSRRARMAVYQRMIGELDANGQHISDQISEIDLTDPEDARVLMPEQGADVVAHFGEDHFLERYQRYKAHIAEWRAQYPRLADVDLRYEQQVVLQMTPGANTAPTAVNAADGKLAPVENANPTDKNEASKPNPSRPAQAVKSAKPAKPHSTAKSVAAKKTAKNARHKPAPKKKHAVPNRATVNNNRQKPVETTAPAAASGQGQ